MSNVDGSSNLKAKLGNRFKNRIKQKLDSARKLKTTDKEGKYDEVIDRIDKLEA